MQTNEFFCLIRVDVIIVQPSFDVFLRNCSSFLGEKLTVMDWPHGRWWYEIQDLFWYITWHAISDGLPYMGVTLVRVCSQQLAGILRFQRCETCMRSLFTFCLWLRSSTLHFICFGSWLTSLSPSDLAGENMTITVSGSCWNWVISLKN